VDSGYWPLFRFDPSKAGEGANPFQLDSKAPKVPFKDYAYNEMRYLMLAKSQPKVAKELMVEAQQGNEQWRVYEQMKDCLRTRKEETNVLAINRNNMMVHSQNH
jgi:pyruvate-ferredoxin/flavodoxin oxidoreductase